MFYQSNLLRFGSRYSRHLSQLFLIIFLPDLILKKICISNYNKINKKKFKDIT